MQIDYALFMAFPLLIIGLAAFVIIRIFRNSSRLLPEENGKTPIFMGK